MRGTRNTGASECRTGIRRSLKPRQRRCRQQISPNPRIAPSLSPPLTHAPPDFEPCQQPPAERCRQNRAAEPNCKTHGASRSRSVEPCQSPRRIERRSARCSVLAVSFTGPTNPLPMAWLANQAARPPTGAASIARQARPVGRSGARKPLTWPTPAPKPTADPGKSWTAVGSPSPASRRFDQRKILRTRRDLISPAPGLRVGRQDRRSGEQQRDRERKCDFAHRFPPWICGSWRPHARTGYPQIQSGAGIDNEALCAISCAYGLETVTTVPPTPL